MSLSRRDFLKLSGGTVVAGAVAGTALKPDEASADEVKDIRIKGAKTTTTVCPFCSVGCGIIVHAKDGKVINTEGDPEHPISEGTLCSKGASIFQMINNPTRLTKPKYRAPGADRMEGRRVGLGAWTRSRNELRRPATRPSRSPRNPRSKKKQRTALRKTLKRTSSSTGRTASPISAVRPWTTKSAIYSRK